MAKDHEKLKSRELRSEGRSIKEIAKLLNVSTGSVSKWCKDVQLTPAQINELERRARDPFYGKRLTYALAQKVKKEQKVKLLLQNGCKEIGTIQTRELFLIGAALYWAEGFKKDSQVGLANSDPKIVLLFIRWLMECLDCKKEDLNFRITLNISHKHRIEDVQNYWKQILNTDSSYFRKPFFQNVKWLRVYEQPNNYYGVLRVKVNKSTDLLRKIHGFIEGLKLNSNLTTSQNEP